MLHVAGLHLDLYSLLRFVFTAIAIGFGLLHLVKKTASKYFIVDANFDEAAAVASGGGESSVGGSKMIAPAAAPIDGPCEVCGVVTKKRCSTCKSVRYCSHNCQSKHWRDGHKFKCRKASTYDSNAKGHQLKKVLFPYEEFVRLYNWEKPGFPPCGLLNCGNSCFANVVLQCLSCTQPLIAYLLEKDHQRECRRNDWCFLCELQLHVERAKLLQPFSPINILSRLPNIGGNLGYGKQEDAHEFMRFVIDTMQSVCLDEFGGEKVLHPSSQETTLIQYTFGGHLQSQVTCTKCNKISYRYENMMDLTVEIQGDAASLEDCLVQFTAEEWLDGENMYKCDGCNDYVKACKRLTIHQAPNILTIALKRFQSGRFGKLNKRVTFPETLDLGPYMSKQGHGTDLYQLYAVVVHVDMLNASYFGHYICYTKDLRGKWYRVDDCKVMTVELEEVLAQGAYMLLYSRTSVRPTFVNLLETSSKDDRRPVEAVKEVEIVKAAEPCQEQLVEPMATEGPTDSVAIVNMTSDTELLSKESVSKNEVPVCMDMDDPLNVSLELTGEADSDTSLHDLVKIKSRPEDTVDMDVDDAFKINFMSDRQDPLERGLSNPESTSGASGDSDDHGSEQSHPIRMASSADNAYSLESEVSGTNNSDECSFDNGNEVEGINNKEFMSLERPLDCSLENKSDIHGMASTSLPCACLNSVTNVPHESSRSFEGPTDPMLDQEKGPVKKNSVAQKGKAPSSAEENSCSQVKMKPLFSSGFLDKRRRSGSSDRNAKALARSREVGLICKTGNNVNGFTKPGARDNGSDCDSKPNSSSIEKQSEQCNGDEIINIELVDCCNGRSHAAEIVDPAKLVNGGCSSSDMEFTSGDATEACNSCSEEFVQPESVTLCSNQADCETNQESSTAPVDISCSDTILLDGSNLDSSHSQHPGLEQVVSVGSGNGHSALRTSEVKSLGATRKGNWSKAKLNPLFSAGFLDKRPGLKPQNSNGNPEIGDGEASNLFEVSNSNGFANASFQVSDHDRMANCNSSNSPNLVKIQCKGNGPNVTKKSNEELGEGGNIQKIQCNGNGNAVDINGNSAILNDPTRGIVRGDQKNLFSRGFLDRPSPKKVIKKVGEDRGMTETVLSEHDCDKQRRAG